MMSNRKVESDVVILQGAFDMTDAAYTSQVVNLLNNDAFESR